MSAAIGTRIVWPSASSSAGGGVGCGSSVAGINRVASSVTIIVNSGGGPSGGAVSDGDALMYAVASRSTGGFAVAIGSGAGATGRGGGGGGGAIARPGGGGGAVARTGGGGAGSGASSASFDPNASMKRAEYSSIRARSASH